MISTSLTLETHRSNVGTMAVFATVGTRRVLIGESKSIGRKRAIIDVLSADPNTGNGRFIANTIKRLEREICGD